MSTNTLSHVFGKKQLWFLVTVCGFAVGFAIGWWILGYYEPSTPEQAWWMELFFWTLPATGAGIGMGLAQWIIIRSIHNNTYLYLWIPATAIGFIVIIGGALLILAVTSYYYLGNLSWLFSNLPSWFIPLTIITPIIIFMGPFLQWLILRQVTNNNSFKELQRMSLGWILSTILLFILLGLTGTAIQTRNEIVNSLGVAMSTIPSGLIFAYFTLGMVRMPSSEIRSL
jgi:MFS family permease